MGKKTSRRVWATHGIGHCDVTSWCRGMSMLDGAKYFASFPEEAPQPNAEPQPDHQRRLMTPELRAALEQLTGELEAFLKEHEQ